MQLAVDEARKGWGNVKSNPMVGCVILDKNHQLIAKGHHEVYGGDHAEISALKNVTDKKILEGAHMFVTLEPCAHVGKTPPCAQTLSVLPLASITFGLIDSNPLVAGRGAKIIREAGIRVLEFQGPTSDLEELIEVHTHNLSTKTPFVTAKIASSLDGQMGLASGESQWITGEEARNHAHYLRAGHAAILIGRGTFETDNPSLDIRLKGYKHLENKVVILDPQGKTLKKIKRSKLYNAHEPKNIIVVVSESLKIKNTDFTVLPAPYKKTKGLDLKLMLKNLYSLGIFSVLVEGGSRTFANLLTENLIQRLVVLQAPSLLGAKGGLAWTRDIKINKLKDKISLTNVKVNRLGQDMAITGRLE